MRTNKLMLAAIAIAMHQPISANEVMKISREYGVDHRDVMSEVIAMLDAEVWAEHDMQML